MDQDRSSVKSNDSGGGFEFVSSGKEDQPELKIANNGDLEELKQSLNELLTEERSMEEQGKRVGGSKFYLASPQSCKEEEEEEEKLQESAPLPTHFIGHDDGAVFNQVSYLGSAAINAPKSEAEIHRNMGVLNREQHLHQSIRVSVRIPSCSAGSIVLLDATTMQEITSYEVQRILFYAHGIVDSPEAACFAFTWSHGDSQESAIFQCHVFRCDIPEAVRQVSTCFAKAFNRTPPKPQPSTLCDETEFKPSTLQSPVSTVSELFTFELNMEIKEGDSKSGFHVIPKDRSQFKLRAHTEKQLCFTVHQVSSGHQHVLQIERCFGVLVCPGRNVRHGDMRLLEMVSMGIGAVPNSYVITAQWDPSDPALLPLNEANDPSGNKTHITVALDLVIRGIQEPVRLQLVTPVKIYPKNERFWNLTKRGLVQQFYLNLKEVTSMDPNEHQFEVLGVDTSGEIDRSRTLGISLSGLMSLQLAEPIMSPREEKPEVEKDEHLSDNDEPMLSGTGSVSKDCSEAILEQWADTLAKWTQSGSRPKQLVPLVRQGIPDALRAEVWQRLAGYSDETMDNYRILISKESSCESVIQRDISRTFPAHDFFKTAGGLGQDSLFRLSKAYAVYDEEIGYCQGLSFLAAALLLHMPEEQAFCVLVRIMYQYKLRDLFKDGFENLNMRLYQLHRLMEDQVPELWQHFQDKGVEEHMYGSQWFLTLFTAKFPLHLVFHILDVFLLQGIDTLFQVALALLKMSKGDLLLLDFEGILKYFRVNLPKKYRSIKPSMKLMKLACSISVKKVRKFEQEFLTLKTAQDNADHYSNELERLKNELQQSDEDRQRLESEVSQVKDMIKREVLRANEERERNEAIIAEYKQICSQLSQRLEEQVQAGKNREMQGLTCPKCRGDPENNWVDPLSADADPRLGAALQRVRELELELAQTKLEHVEAECRNQDLTHQLSAASSELQASKGSWLNKTLSSIKEAAKKDGSTLLPTRRDSKDGMSRDAA